MITEQLLEDAFEKFKKLNPGIENPEEAFAKDIAKTIKESLTETEQL